MGLSPWRRRHALAKSPRGSPLGGPWLVQNGMRHRPTIVIIRLKILTTLITTNPGLQVPFRRPAWARHHTHAASLTSRRSVPGKVRKGCPDLQPSNTPCTQERSPNQVGDSKLRFRAEASLNLWNTAIRMLGLVGKTMKRRLYGTAYLPAGAPELRRAPNSKGLLRGAGHLGRSYK